MDTITWVILILTGILGGFLGGLIGIGGGIIFVVVLPLLLVPLGVPEAELAQFTIANSLFAAFWSSVAASFTFIRQKTFYWRPTLVIGLSSVVISSLVLQFWVNTPYFNHTMFSVLVLSLLLYMLVRTYLFARYPGPFVQEASLSRLLWVGAASGVVAPTTGLGGGILIIPILNTVYKFEIPRATSISLGVIGITSLNTTLINLMAHPQTQLTAAQTGYIVWPLAGVLSLGVVLGSPWGIAAAKKLSPKTISYTFSAFILLSILRKVWTLIF